MDGVIDEQTAPRRPRRARSALESLLSITLVLEAVLMFFVALVVFGLKIVDPGTAFVGGIGLMLVLALTALTVRWRWGVGLGWVLQGVIVATGTLVPLMFVIGAGFVVLWIYCFVRGRAIDREKSRYLEENPA